MKANLLKIQIAVLIFIGLSACACNKKSTNGDHAVIDPPTGVNIFDWSASWNRTNNKIAYMHAENDTTNTVYPSGIYVIDPDGGNRIRIFLSRRVIDLDWSPDGRWVVANEHGRLFKISYPDGEVDTILQSSDYYSPAWSPDGSKIACALRLGNPNGIFTLNEDGSDYRMIIPYADYPTWYSADSIIYLNWSNDYPSGSICISDTNGLGKRLILDGTSYGIIYFQNIKADYEKKRIVAFAYIPGGRYSVWTYDIEQNELRSFLYDADFPNFSPDGDSIIYTDTRVGYGNLNILCWDSTGARQLTDPVGGEGGGL